MKLIDAEPLIEIEKNAYQRTESLLYKMDYSLSIIDMHARKDEIRRFLSNLKSAPTFETIYGYNIKDLIVVAERLKAKGCLPDDVTKYYRAFKEGYETAHDEFQRQFNAAIEKAMGKDDFDG